MERASVIFESMFGNTQAVAEAVAEGLSSRFAVGLLEVSRAPTMSDDVSLLIVGAPTHAFGLSRSRTREDAANQAAGSLVSAGIGLREWLRTLPRPARDV